MLNALACLLCLKLCQHNRHSLATYLPMQFKVEQSAVPTELEDIIGIHSYFLSPIALAFFVGPYWNNTVGIHVHAGKIKIDWPIPKVKHFPGPM